MMIGAHGWNQKNLCAAFAAVVLAFFAGSQAEHAWSHTAYVLVVTCACVVYRLHTHAHLTVTC